jgi:hypothetical protein
MSSIYTGCSTDTLVAIPNECLISFAQATRLIFTKLEDGGTANTIATAADAHLTLATYEALIAASDDTKMVITPQFGNPTMPDAEPRTALSGNQAPSGNPLNLGNQPTSFSCTFYGLDPKSEAAMKQLNGTLGVYMISHEGQIMGQTDDLDTPTLVKPIPIFNLFVGDAKLGGYDEPDSNILSFSLYAGWSESRIIFTPNFNPLTDF